MGESKNSRDGIVKDWSNGIQNVRLIQESELIYLHRAIWLHAATNEYWLVAWFLAW
jgi:hypothetical protein